MPKKNQKKVTAREVNEDGQVVEVDEVGVPGLFPVQRWDIEEEMSTNSAYMEYQRENRGSEI